MKLKVRLLPLTAGRPIAIVHEKTAHKIGVHSNERLRISKNKHSATAVADIAAKNFMKEDQIALSSDLKQLMKLKERQEVEVNLAPLPESLQFIRKKMENKSLSESEILHIISDLVNDVLPEPEIAFFIAASHMNGMSINEIFSLIHAFTKTGDKLDFKQKIVADKHSIGGVAGNRTTPIVVSICAAAGLTIPKNSSRAITSAAGTADVIETIANVDFSVPEIYRIVKKTNACLVWGGSWGLVPADEKIITVEKTLKLDDDAFLLASILSKKLAAGSTHILIDIPYGSSAKVNHQRALLLKEKFEHLGKMLKKNIKCVLTNGNQPIGNGIGPALELNDVISVLKQSQQRPLDLEKKAVFLAGQLLELTESSKKGNGQSQARKILESGQALTKFNEIIEAQGGSLDIHCEAPFKYTYHTQKHIILRSISNKGISSLARICGCPADKCAGVYLHAHVKDKVQMHDPLLTLHAESKSRLEEAKRYFERHNSEILS